MRDSLASMLGAFYFIAPAYRGFQIDELHHHNQNLLGTLHKGVPTVVYQHENCCIRDLLSSGLKTTTQTDTIPRAAKMFKIRVYSYFNLG